MLFDIFGPTYAAQNNVNNYLTYFPVCLYCANMVVDPWKAEALNVETNKLSLSLFRKPEKSKLVKLLIFLLGNATDKCCNFIVGNRSLVSFYNRVLFLYKKLKLNMV